VDRGEPDSAGLIERCAAHLFQQLFDHAADAHHLGRLFDLIGWVRLNVARSGNRHPIGRHDDNTFLLIGCRAVGTGRAGVGHRGKLWL
jgi:hypothetical protein